MGATADKIAKAFLVQERFGGVDRSSNRITTATRENESHGDDRLQKLLADGHDPAHAPLICAQNFASHLTEQMSTMKQLRHFTRFLVQAEDEYVPGFPPISPVTLSHFTTWALFDVLFGQSHETIGTCLLRLARDLPLPPWLIEAIGAIQRSRMGFYIHQGFEDRFVRFREVDSEEIRLCLPTSGYKGEKGEIWFGRLVPPMNSAISYHVLFTTPYILIRTTETMIAAYFRREVLRLEGMRLPGGMDAHEFILKHGPSPNHWNEYIFCAYSNYQSDAVFISGVPDDRMSLPHGDLIRSNQSYF